MITDVDLNKIIVLNKITLLDVSGSLVTDKGVGMVLEELKNLK